MNKTKLKLIEAAEQEFAEHGFHGASVRDITNRAETNIASVNYHFGSKETLFIEMIRHRLEPINTLRVQMLDEAITKAGKRPLRVKQIVDILVRPLIESFVDQANNQAFMRAMGRGMSEESGFMQQIYDDVLAEVVRRSRHELARTLSDLPEATTDLSFAYLRSTISGVMQIRKNNLTQESCIQFPDTNTMVAYISGGIEAIAKDHRNNKK